MAKKIPNIDTLTDTFNTWLTRTNSVIDSLGTEVITANSTLGITGTSTSPVNSRLWGTFTSSNVVATAGFTVPNAFTVSPTSVSITAPLSINGSVGTAGQILTSTGSNLAWTALSINTPANGGLEGGPITSSGELRVKKGNGILVDTNGVSVDIPFVQSQLVTISTLQGRTWDAPGALGTTTANSGIFTSVSSNEYRITGRSTDNFLLSSSVIRIAGTVDAMTPGNGISDTTGGVRIRARGSGRSVLQFTNEAGTGELGNLSVDSIGNMYWPKSLHVSSGNASGGGLVLSDEGDFVDLNDGYGNFRFQNGIAVYSGNKSGISKIRLKSNGDIEADGVITSGGNALLTLGNFTSGTGVGEFSTAGSTGNWVRLPNGMLLQWGTIPATQNSYSTIYFPQAFSTSAVSVTVSGGIRAGVNDAQQNPLGVTEVASSYFSAYQAENVTTTAWWMAMGF